MDKKQKAEEKALEISSILKEIEDGVLETVVVTGVSPIWKSFVKLRRSDTKMFVEYVQCQNCKGLVPFMSRSGTSNVLKHKCKTPKEENFKDLPDEKVEDVKQFLMDKIIACSATDFCPIEFFCGPGFLRMAQSLVALGDKHGNIGIEGVFPNLNAIKRQMIQVKEEKRQTLLDIFKEAYKLDWCSLSIKICNSNGIDKKPLLATFSMHYFDKELTALRKNNIFAIGIDPDDDPQISLMQIIRSFNIFGGDENQLKGMNIVTPNTVLMKTVLGSFYSRQDCIPYKIHKILEASFKNSSCKRDDFYELIKTSRNIIRFIKDSGKSHQLEIDVKIDCESWTSKIKMLQALMDHYDNVMKILDGDKENNFVLNKKLMSEVVSFVTPFIEAVNDLAATEYPTANRIVLWWSLLKSHLEDDKNYSFYMKNIMKKAESIIDNELHPSMNNKIDCFLDPRYRWLKMFSQTERDAVYTKVREILKDVPEAEPRDLQPSSISEAPPPKKSRFSRFESTNVDVSTNDEVNMYLQGADSQTVNFDSEFNLIGIFWKNSRGKFPKLFQLAVSRLHLPASCSNINSDGYVEQKITLDKLNDLMLISSSLKNMNK